MRRRTESCTWRGMIRLRTLPRTALPASSVTSAHRYSRTAARYTGGARSEAAGVVQVGWTPRWRCWKSSPALLEASTTLTKALSSLGELDAGGSPSGEGADEGLADAPEGGGPGPRWGDYRRKGETKSPNKDTSPSPGRGSSREGCSRQAERVEGRSLDKSTWKQTNPGALQVN